MTTAYTSLLGFSLPVTGELSGTWGDTVNDGITKLLDSAIAGTTTITTDADVTLTTTTGASNTSRQAIILWTAGGTATRTITAPAQSKIYTVINASSSTQSIILAGVGPTSGVTIAKGESALVAWNGSDFIKISNTAGPGTFTDLTVTGNTTLGNAVSDTITVNSQFVTGTVLRSAQALTNTLALAAYDVDGAAYTNLITLTAANEPTLALTSTGVGTINKMSIGATTASTGAFTTLTSNGATTFTAGTASTTTGTGTLVITGGLGVSGRINAANFDGIVGANTAAAGSFTTLGATGVLSVTASAVSTIGGFSATDAPTSMNLRLNRTAAQFNGIAFAGAVTYDRGIYLRPSSDTINIGRSAGSAFTDQLSVDGAGNVGVGVTPTTGWYGTAKVIQMGTTGAVFGRDGNEIVGLTSNAYNSAVSTTTFRYIAGGNYATNYLQTTGQHQWFNAGVGTSAGDLITFSQAMTLDASGNLGIGATSPVAKLQIKGSGTSGQVTSSFILENNSSGTLGMDITGTAGSSYWRLLYGGGPSTGTNTLSLGMSMVLEGASAGNVGIGTSNPTFKLDVAGNIRGLINNASVGNASSMQLTQNGSGDAAISFLIGATTEWLAGVDNSDSDSFKINAITGGSDFTGTGITITTGGNLGVGVTSVLGRAQFNVSDTSTTILNSTVLYLSNTGAATTNQRIDLGFRWQDGTYNGNSAISAIRESGTARLTALAFCPSNSSGDPVEKMRLDSSGNLLVGTTSAGVADTSSVTLERTSAFAYYVVNHVTGSASGDKYAYFGYAGSTIGSITQSGTTAVLYNVTSDQRLKENIQDAESASVLIDSLKVRQFDWKTDNSHQRYGFVAQELVAIAPEAVHQPADQEEMMAVDYSKLVPMLVKEIQSLRKRITALEGA